MKKVPCNAKCDIKLKNSIVFCNEVYLNGEICKGVWELKGQIGEKSANAVAYNACNEEGCSHIAKVSHIKTRDYMMREVEMQNRAYDLGLAPKIEQMLISDTKNIIIMGKMEMTLKRAILDVILEPRIPIDEKKKIILNFFKEVYESLSRLHKAGIVHGDFHVDNIMFNPKTGKWLFIDFGDSKISKNRRDFILDYNILFKTFEDMTLNKELKTSKLYPIIDYMYGDIFKMNEAYKSKEMFDI